MVHLSERDIRSVLELAYDAASIGGDEPFPGELLSRIAELIPADAMVGYHEAVIGSPCRVVEFVEIPPDGLPTAIEEAGGRFREQDPLRHRIARHATGALKLSDFLTRREMHRLEFYWHVWRPLGIDDSLRVWLPAPAGRARVVYLERGGRDFTERDRSVLDLLRPFLIRVQQSAGHRRHAKKAATAVLTKREREILSWIARGKTSRQIATILHVSPYTVRKHTENMLGKLDVSTRSAAVARAFAGLEHEGEAPDS